MKSLRRALGNLEVVNTSKAGYVNRIVFKKNGVKQLYFTNSMLGYSLFHCLSMSPSLPLHTCVILLLGLVTYRCYVYMFVILLFGLVTHRRYVYV